MQDIAKTEQGPISVEAIHEMVEEAINIPSVAKGKPTQFIVLNEIETLSKASEIVPYHPLTVKALSAIVVCGDLYGAQIKDKWMLDCESASQQLLLAAHANGLGAHISLIYPESDRIYRMTVLLDLPENIVAHSYVAMGYPAKGPDSSHIYSNKRIHYNNWAR